MDVNLCVFFFSLCVFHLSSRNWVYVTIWIPFLDYLFRYMRFCTMCFWCWIVNESRDAEKSNGVLLYQLKAFVFSIAFFVDAN